MNMYFKDKERAKALIELEIANRENLLLLLPTIKNTVENFNGKVLNKRFKEALNASIKRHSEYIPYSNISCEWGRYFRIDFRVGNRCVPDGEYSVCYIDNPNLILCSCEPETAMSVNEKGTKRLISSGVIDGIEVWEKEMIDYIDSNKEALNHIGEWQDRFKNLEREFNTLKNEIPADVRNYFGFNWYLTK